MARDTYHHGALREALLTAGLAHARTGGPQAISLRELTREVGVSVNAAYRHFDGLPAFMAELAVRCQGKLAEYITAQRPAGLTGSDLLAHVGQSYIGFAVTEPGWFRTAFGTPTDLSRSGDADAGGSTGRSPFQQLSDALDQMVADGVLPPERRPAAEFPCWSAVHGFAELCLGGPLRSLPREQQLQLGARCVAVAVAGIAQA